jgi:uncharacterized delta-60 repeat protein
MVSIAPDRRRGVVFLALALLHAMVGLTCAFVPASLGATGSTTVTANVLSATNLDASACMSGASNVTDFGSLAPGTSNVTTSDCGVVFGSSNDTSMLRLFQSDGLSRTMWHTPTGSFDAGFDGDGIATTPIVGGTDIANDVVMQSDGRIVAAGQADNPSADFGLARYNANGSLDTTFDTDGKVTTPVGTANDVVNEVLVQPDGKLVAIGSAASATWNVGVVRYNANGSLDTTFDTDGKVTTDLTGTLDEGWAGALQPDGKIVVVGRTTTGIRTQVLVLRYTAGGALDTTFDADGIVVTSLSANDEMAVDLELLPTGKILVAADSATPTADVVLMRFNADGSLDTTFDGDGMASS